MLSNSATNLDDIAVAYVNGSPITVAYMLDSLRLWQQGDILNGIIRRFVLETLFVQHGIEADEEEVEEFQIRFREEHELYEESTTCQWMSRFELTDEDFWRFCEFNAKRNRLKRQVVGNRVDQHFALVKLDLQQVELYHIVAATDDTAREIKSLVAEGEDFCALARRFSIEEETRKQCGYMGLVGRRQLRPEIEARAFQSQPGEVIGPFKGVQGFHLYLVNEIVYPSLTAEVRSDLEEKLFEQYLKQQLEGYKIERVQAPLPSRPDDCGVGQER